MSVIMINDMSDSIRRVRRNRHAKLKKKEVYPFLKEVRPVRAVYAEIEDLGVDRKAKLWLPPLTSVFPATEAIRRQSNGAFMFRLIVLPAQRIADLSTGEFSLNGVTGDRLVRDGQRDYAAEGWLKVRRIIRTQRQREKLEATVATVYKKDIGRNVLQVAAPFIGDDALVEHYNTELKGYGLGEDS